MRHSSISQQVAYQLTVMNFLVIILILSFGYLHAQSDDRGICIVWGDPHLTGFPTSQLQASFRSSYWCRWSGRMLILKNEFIEFYVNVTEHPFWNEYYEITLLYNETKLCTITPDGENCPRDFVQVTQIRDPKGTTQIIYTAADDMDISVNSYWNNGRLVYNIDIVQSIRLILRSSGLCVTRLPQCTLESSGRRARSTSDTVVYEACDLFISEANKTAKKLTGQNAGQLVTHAREACVTDMLVTNDVSWGGSAAWFVLTDNIRQANLSSSERRELMAQISDSVQLTVAVAKPKAELVMGITTATGVSETTESTRNVSTTVSSSNTTKFVTYTSTESTRNVSTTVSSSNTTKFVTYTSTESTRNVSTTISSSNTTKFVTYTSTIPFSSSTNKLQVEFTFLSLISLTTFY
ncbi:unnamed protein product [Adineta ricciae]|uniref:Uncharacterized protein n=1 Tax=Adineta ricciae TaxID=249248 RepID=A0A813QA94_ADIRI|nr:unnamed protein product [Adineta ricciae]